MLVTTSCLYRNWIKASRPHSAALTTGPLDLVAWSCTWSNQCLNTPPWSCLKDLPWPIFQISRWILPSFRVPKPHPWKQALADTLTGPLQHRDITLGSSHPSSHQVRIQRNIQLVLVSPGIFNPLLIAHELSVLFSVSDLLCISAVDCKKKERPYFSTPPCFHIFFNMTLKLFPSRSAVSFSTFWIWAGLVNCICWKRSK